MDNALIIDLVLAAVLIAFAVIGAYKGLIRSLMALVSVVLALAGAALLTAMFVEPVTELVYPRVQEKVITRFAQDIPADALAQEGGDLNAGGLLPADLADALGGEGKPARDVIRSYFLKDFFKDHCQIYKKRPIYWMFDSGKKNGFKCLVYMHRYQPDLLARIRTDYVHEQQERYRAQIGYANDALAGAERGERVRLDKRVKKLNDQLKETIGYEEKLHHLADQMIKIDLDDGVKVNYAKFQDVLAKIK